MSWYKQKTYQNYELNIKTLTHVLPEIRTQTYFKLCLSEVPVSGTGQFPSLKKSNGSRIPHLFFSVWDYDYSVLSAKGCNLPKGLDISKSFFPQRPVGHWDMLPREVVTAPSLPEFGQHSQAHGGIIGVVLCRASSWTRWSFRGPFQFRIFYDSKFTSGKKKPLQTTGINLGI